MLEEKRAVPFTSQVPYWYRDVARAEVDRFRRRLSWSGSLAGVRCVSRELNVAWN